MNLHSCLGLNISHIAKSASGRDKAANSAAQHVLMGSMTYREARWLALSHAPMAPQEVFCYRYSSLLICLSTQVVLHEGGFRSERHQRCWSNAQM